jgi:ATP-binding cassette subfamily F protein 3
MAHVDSPFDFSFKKPDKMPNPLLKLDKACIGYGNKIIIKNISLTITPGDRVGLLGSNGAGKSSLIKVLAGEMLPLSGERLEADALKIGYFAQHQLEQLRTEESPLWHLQQLDKKATEKDLRNFLGGFNFQGDKVLEAIKPFSGGEKARLVLALLVYQNPNVLLLDEPTNHLDLDMRHALNIALQAYEGALVVVSHDRHLLRTVTDKFYLVAHGKVEAYDGDLDDYRQWLNDQRKDPDKTNFASTEISTVSRKDQRKHDAERRQRLKPIYDALKKAEHDVEKYHQEQRQLETALADPSLYDDANKAQLKQLLTRKIAVDNALESAEEAWLTAEELIAAD